MKDSRKVDQTWPFRFKEQVTAENEMLLKRVFALLSDAVVVQLPVCLT